MKIVKIEAANEEPMKITNIKTIKATPFLEFNEIHFNDKNGKPAKWYSVSRVGGTNAVVIVAYVDTDEGRKIVVTKEFRVPIGDYEWGFPAGLIDEGESVEQTVARELKEETGLDVVEVLEVSPFVYNSAGLTDEAVSMAYVKADGVLSTDFLESSEDIETFLMGKDEVEDLLGSESKLGAKSWIVLQNFVRRGEIL